MMRAAHERMDRVSSHPHRGTRRAVLLFPWVVESWHARPRQTFPFGLSSTEQPPKRKLIRLEIIWTLGEPQLSICISSFIPFAVRLYMKVLRRSLCCCTNRACLFSYPSYYLFIVIPAREIHTVNARLISVFSSPVSQLIRHG